MKRSEMLVIIANQLDFLNGKFEGFRSGVSPEELSRANVILTTIEQAGMKPPYRAVGPFEENFTWEPENENKKG